MIVPFWADVNTALGGIVSYRETTDPALLAKASAAIQSGFPGTDINLNWAFITTWDNVAFHGANANCGGNTKRNTFQAILASTDASQSFVIYLYNSVTWTSSIASNGNCTGLGGNAAKAGFDYGDNFKFFDIGGTCTESIVNVPHTTNVDAPGKWVFRVDYELQSTGCLNRLQTASEQIAIVPSFVPIFGNIPITIEGACLSGASQVQVRFNDVRPTTVNASISSSKVATCVLPYLYTNGRIQVDLFVTRVGGTVQTFKGFIYTTKQGNELVFRLVNGSVFEMSWNEASFAAGVTLDLELLELVGGVWTSRGVVKKNLQNTGHFSGPFNRHGRCVFEKLRNIYVVKLGLSPNMLHVSPDHPLISRVLIDLETRSESEIYDLCDSWYIQDQGAPTDVLPCPRTLTQAQADERFEPVTDLLPWNPEAQHGFIQRNPSPSNAGSRCVYKNGVLLVGPPSGGNVQSVSPNSVAGETAHILADLVPLLMCCHASTDERSCEKYYERRPSDDGSRYVPPKPGSSIGDPHITTPDGSYYTFLGYGEFWFIKSYDNSFSMQGRTAKAIGAGGQWTGATVCSAYVMQQRTCQATVTVQVALGKNMIEISVDGHVLVYDDQKRNVKHNGASISIVSPKDVRVTFSSGYSFRFTYHGQVINLVTLLDTKLQGKFKGLFGVFDGNQSNDFTRPDGTIMSRNVPQRQIHEYGMLWQITSEETLFTYPIGKTYADFRDPYFEPSFAVPDIDAMPPELVAACRGNPECLLDLYLTGDLELAVGTLDTMENLQNKTNSFSVSCIRPGSPASGHLEITNFQEGSTVKLVCERAFYKIVGSDEITCVRDENGNLMWNGQLGECINKCKSDNAWEQYLCEIEFGRYAPRTQ